LASYNPFWGRLKFKWFSRTLPRTYWENRGCL